MTTGICPVCNGTHKMAVPDTHRNYAVKYGYYGYDALTDTIECNNCGAQMQFSKATGQVPLRTDGTPCKHEYTSQNAGRCLTKHTCKHCSHTYTIDSGD